MHAAAKAAAYTAVQMYIFQSMEKSGKAMANFVSNLGAMLAFQMVERSILKKYGVKPNGEIVDPKGLLEEVKYMDRMFKNKFIVTAVSQGIQAALAGDDKLESMGIILSAATNSYLSYTLNKKEFENIIVNLAERSRMTEDEIIKLKAKKESEGLTKQEQDLLNYHDSDLDYIKQQLKNYGITAEMAQNFAAPKLLKDRAQCVLILETGKFTPEQRKEQEDRLNYFNKRLETLGIESEAEHAEGLLNAALKATTDKYTADYDKEAKGIYKKMIRAMIQEGVMRGVIAAAMNELTNQMAPKDNPFRSPLQVAWVNAGLTGFMQGLFVKSSNIFTIKDGHSGLPLQFLGVNNYVDGSTVLKDNLKLAENPDRGRLQIAMASMDAAVIRGAADAISLGRAGPILDFAKDGTPTWTLGPKDEFSAFNMGRYVDFIKTYDKYGFGLAFTDQVMSSMQNQSVNNIYDIVSGNIQKPYIVESQPSYRDVRNRWNDLLAKLEEIDPQLKKQFEDAMRHDRRLANWFGAALNSTLLIGGDSILPLLAEVAGSVISRKGGLEDFLSGIEDRISKDPAMASTDKDALLAALGEYNNTAKRRHAYLTGRPSVWVLESSLSRDDLIRLGISVEALEKRADLEGRKFIGRDVVSDLYSGSNYGRELNYFANISSPKEAGYNPPEIPRVEPIEVPNATAVTKPVPKATAVTEPVPKATAVTKTETPKVIGYNFKQIDGNGRIIPNQPTYRVEIEPDNLHGSDRRGTVYAYDVNGNLGVVVAEGKLTFDETTGKHFVTDDKTGKRVTVETPIPRFEAALSKINSGLAIQEDTVKMMRANPETVFTLLENSNYSQADQDKIKRVLSEKYGLTPDYAIYKAKVLMEELAKGREISQFGKVFLLEHPQAAREAYNELVQENGVGASKNISRVAHKLGITQVLPPQAPNVTKFEGKTLYLKGRNGDSSFNYRATDGTNYIAREPSGNGKFNYIHRINQDNQ